MGPGSYAMNAQLGLRSGHRLRGTDLPSREYGTGVRWRAPAGGSFFAKRANSQGYPSDGSVRDLTVAGIEFYGNTPVLPPNTVDGGSYTGNTQWYTEFRDCGFIGAPLMSGWGDGFHVTGNTHVQAITDTWVTCGGSENSLFTGGGISFLDSGVMGAGKPFIRMFSDMWTMGSAMISARGNCYQLLVSGGGNGRVMGTYFDAPASQRTSSRRSTSPVAAPSASAMRRSTTAPSASSAPEAPLWSWCRATCSTTRRASRCSASRASPASSSGATTPTPARPRAR